MVNDNAIIRDALPSDREAILSFTRNTFTWGDYLPEVWDEWFKAKDGRLLVAEVEGIPVGTVHLRFIGNREGWMEGMRVHPGYRKQGLATALDREAQNLARNAGCRVLRLETASTNLAAQSAIVTYGYRRMFAIREWEASALTGDVNFCRLARTKDLVDLYNLWDRSWMRLATKELLHFPEGWRWGKLTRQRLHDDISKGLVYVSYEGGKPRGFAILHRDTDYLGVDLLVGRADTVSRILGDMRKFAAVSGYHSLSLMLPDFPRAGRWAETAGFAKGDHTMLIYECLLRPTRQ